LHGFAAPEALMAITVSGLASVFCSVSDHETTTNASAMNTTPIPAENLSDFPENTELMVHLLT
jgi:hypothetical protein